MLWIWVFVGGGLGSVLRYFLAVHLPNLGATLLANVLACGILGALSARQLSPQASVLLMTGFCGGLSTFSTLVKEGGALDFWGTWLYWLGSLVLGSLAFAAAARWWAGL